MSAGRRKIAGCSRRSSRTQSVNWRPTFRVSGHNANTPDRERKRVVRLLLEDVTLVRGEQITLHLRFRGGGRAWAYRLRKHPGSGGRHLQKLSESSMSVWGIIPIRKSRPCLMSGGFVRERDRLSQLAISFASRESMHLS